ncbi:MAG: nucleotidyltransferase family protein [Vicinamibacteraceae bacterium]
MSQEAGPGPTPRRRTAAVVPAAGQSTRFGSRKLIADVDGVPLIERTIASLLQAGVDRVIVVVRAGDDFEGVPSLADARVTTVVNPDPALGMFSSIQTGLAVCGGDVVLVLPADMPFVPASVVAAVAARAFETDSIVVPVYQTRRGHPLAVPRAIADRLLTLAPTGTLKDGLAGFGLAPVPLDVADPGILRDVDVPADLTR